MTGCMRTHVSFLTRVQSSGQFAVMRAWDRKHKKKGA